MESNDIITVNELAGILRVSESHIYSLVKQNEIPYIKIGTAIRFNRKEILEVCSFRNNRNALNFKSGDSPIQKINEQFIGDESGSHTIMIKINADKINDPSYLKSLFENKILPALKNVPVESGESQEVYDAK